MKKLNQSGFSPIAVLLALILIVLVGFTGYYVYNSQKETNNSSQATPQDTKGTNTNQAPAESAPQSSTQKYLVFKEWGVKIPLTPPIEDAYYVIKNDYVYLSTKSITTKYPECAADKTTLFAYGRFNDPNKEVDLPAAGQTYGEAYPNAPKVGAYYYTGANPQAACFSANSESEGTKIYTEVMQPISKAFGEALTKIQAE